MQILTVDTLAKMIHKFYRDYENPMHDICWKDLAGKDREFWINIADKLLSTLRAEDYIS
jgi:hypothetical protein